MQYREDKKSNVNLSVLGFGCMRFPGSFGRIDKDKTEKLILRAIDAGVNYFDTAYAYPGSEEMLGTILDEHRLRDKIYIATKIPHGGLSDTGGADLILAKQLQRLRTEHIDFYLIHNLSSYRQWERLVDIGIKDWIKTKKDCGTISRIGFSWHGSQEDFKKVLDAYDWDFTQIQYNYINENYQAGKDGLHYAAAKNLPVIIMEPLLGGKLAGGLPDDAMRIMDRTRPGSTPASWAFRWLWDQPGVTVVLSGMNELAQLDENIAGAEDATADMLTDDERAAMSNIVEAFNASYKTPCTGCNYCMPCPKGINIPACFSAYNTSYAMGWMTGMMLYANSVGFVDNEPHFVTTCIKCGACEEKCPQSIEIRRELSRVAMRFEPPGIKTAAKIARKFMR